jgi:hypothetical protein
MKITGGWMRIAPLLAAAMLAVPAVTACEGGDNPKPAPLPTSSATATTPPPNRPTLPAEAQRLDKGGALAFVRYWIELFNYATASGDTAGLRAVSSAKCESCTAIADKIDRTYATGGHVESNGWTVLSLDMGATPSNIHGAVLMSPQRVFEPRGKNGTNFPGGRASLFIGLTQRNSAWILLTLEQK